MVVVYSGPFPPDLETDAKNFHRNEAEQNYQRKQAECKAAYLNTREPRALLEAVRNARGYLQLPTELNWLMAAVGEFIASSITAQMAERCRERMRHVQRYRCVRDLRQKGHIKDCALDLAVTALEATDAAGMRSTIEASYNKVSRDLKRAGREGEYFYLVARSDPTVVPVSVTRRSDGATVINGVAQRSTGVIIVSPTVYRGDR